MQAPAAEFSGYVGNLLRSLSYGVSAKRLDFTNAYWFAAPPQRLSLKAKMRTWSEELSPAVQWFMANGRSTDF